MVFQTNPVNPTKHPHFGIVKFVFLFLSHSPAFAPYNFDYCLVDLNFQLYRHFLVTNNTVVSLHLFHGSRALFLQSASVPSSAAKLEPRYVKEFVDGIRTTLHYHLCLKMAADYV